MRSASPQDGHRTRRLGQGQRSRPKRMPGAVLLHVGDARLALGLSAAVAAGRATRVGLHEALEPRTWRGPQDGARSPRLHTTPFIEDARAWAGEVDAKRESGRTVLSGPARRPFNLEINDGPCGARFLTDLTHDPHGTWAMDIVPDRQSPNCSGLFGHVGMRVRLTVEGDASLIQSGNLLDLCRISGSVAGTGHHGRPAPSFHPRSAKRNRRLHRLVWPVR